MGINDEDAVHFALVSAAHRFLLAAHCGTREDSGSALARFFATATIHKLRTISLDAVIIRVLRVMDQRRGGRVPMLVERYLELTRDNPEPLGGFCRCVEEALRLRRFRDPDAQRAVALIDESYSDASLSLTEVATRLRLQPIRLCRVFRSETSVTVMAYLREVRLNQAAVRLVASSGRIKDVWSAVGYNHASNFNHDFARRFGMPPREFRTRGVRPLIPSTPDRSARQVQQPPPKTNAVAGRRVLVVEDDDSMRETYEKYLSCVGYAVAAAATGEDGLRQISAVAPDVVLLDYRLPDQDGFACLRRLRADTLLKQPAVILFTADWTVEDRAVEALALGARIQSKLCDLEDVEVIVRDLCHQTGAV